MIQNACVYTLVFINLFVKKYSLNAHANIQVEEE